MKDSAYYQKSLLFRFRTQTERKDLFKKNNRVLIACSGGPDSVALFHLVRLSFPDLKIGLVHFNHGLRPRTAKRDELFVKNLAKRFAVSFFCGHANLSRKSERKKLSIEEAARARRYAFFKTAYKKSKARAILFAHHLDDQAETVLMRVCQGTGLRGLLGIRDQMVMDRMRVVRPLLSFSKVELLQFLEENHFLSCHDETNHATDFLRNRLRLEVLPYLAKKVNPRILSALARIPEIIRDENDFIAEKESEAAKKVIVIASSAKVILKASLFRGLHPALQFRILDGALKRMDPAAGLLFETGLLIQKSLKNKVFRLSLPRGVELSGNARLILLQKSPLKS